MRLIKKLKKYKLTIFEIFISFFLIASIPVGLIYAKFRQLTYQADWTVGEWLINYQGGFTRRGLPGSIIYHISSNYYLPPWLIAFTISIIFWLCLTVLLLYLTRKNFSPIIILSSFVCLSPLVGEYLVRKDCFNLLILAISSLLASSINNSKKINLELSQLFILNLLGSIAILTHESYFFYAIPSLAIIFTYSNRDKFFSFRKRLLNALIKLSPMFFITLLCYLFKGNESIAISINNSWKSLEPFIPGEYFENPSGAIKMIGMPTEFHLKYSLSPIIFKLANGFIWKPISLFFSTSILYVLLSSKQILKSEEARSNAQVIRKIFILINLTMLPIFIAGHDYGRWLFMILTTTILTANILISQKSIEINQKTFLGFFNKFLWNPPSLLNWQFLIVTLFFGIPPYWQIWSLSLVLKTSIVGFLTQFGVDIIYKLTNNQINFNISFLISSFIILYICLTIKRNTNLEKRN